MSKKKLSKRKVNIISKFFGSDFSYITIEDFITQSPYISPGPIDLIPSTDVSGTRYISNITFDLTLYLMFMPQVFNPVTSFTLPLYCNFVVVIYRQGADSLYNPINPDLLDGSYSPSQAVSVAYPQSDIVGSGMINLGNHSVNSIPQTSSGSSIVPVQLSMTYGLTDTSNVFYNFPGLFSLESGDILRIYFFVPDYPYQSENPYRTNFIFGVNGFFRCAVSF